MSNPDLSTGSHITMVTHRFRMHELAIRRLHAADPEFRAVCEDLAAALKALDFWTADPARTAEYRTLVDELDAEILESLGVPKGALAKTGSAGSEGHT